MPVYSRQPISAGVSGVRFVSATVEADAQIVHQVQATSTSEIESLWLRAHGMSAAGPYIFQMVYDTATATGVRSVHIMSDRTVDLADFDVFKGLPLTGTDTIVRAYVSTATSGISFNGYYNRIATG